MKDSKKIEELAKKLRNERAKEWTRKNRDKVKEINKRYWLKKAKEILEEENNNKGGK